MAVEKLLKPLADISKNTDCPTVLKVSNLIFLSPPPSLISRSLSTISDATFIFPLWFHSVSLSGMESAAALRSFNYSVGNVSHLQPTVERSSKFALHYTPWSTAGKFPIQGLAFGGALVSSKTRREGAPVPSVKTPETSLTSKSSAGPLGSVEKNSLRSATFPNGFEALILEVCDETEVVELKLKVGEFEMHLKRNIEAKAPMSVVYPTTPPPPPVPSKPLIESASAAPPKSLEKISPFANVAAEKSAKLAALEASGASGYALVSSPTVGTFRRGRTVKGKKLPPGFKEGDLIKEGQVMGYLDQFGTELPVKSDMAGEVLKILVNDGESVGYGDPLIAVLPSFHGIQ